MKASQKVYGISFLVAIACWIVAALVVIGTAIQTVMWLYPLLPDLPTQEALMTALAIEAAFFLIGFTTYGVIWAHLPIFVRLYREVMQNETKSTR